MSSRQVALIDDDEDCHEACRRILHPAGWQVRSFLTASEAILAAQSGALPSPVLMDMSLPGESAPRAIAEILRIRPATLMVVLTAHQRQDFVFEALRAGAVGYLLKQHAIDELADLLALVERGGSPVSPSIARRILEYFHPDPVPPVPPVPLSPREQEILRGFAAGRSYGEVASELGIAIDTVRTHVRRLYQKLEVSGRTQAVLAAQKRGLLGL